METQQNMESEQDVANNVASTLKALEDGIAQANLPVLNALMAAHHQSLSNAFVFIRDETDLDVEWAPIADIMSGGEAAKGAYTDGGGPKEEPAAKS